MAKNPATPIEEQKRASIRDGALILYFDTAEIPSVGRFDLDSLAQASFEIADKRENSYYITLRDFSVQTRDVARFGTKAEALQALQAILQALLSQRENKDNGKTCCKSSSGCFLWRLLKGLVFLALAIFLLYLLLAFITADPSAIAPRNAPSVASSPLATIPEGQSVDADAILSEPEQPTPAVPQAVAPIAP